jgi:hypothetical protein
MDEGICYTEMQCNAVQTGCVCRYTQRASARVGRITPEKDPVRGKVSEHHAFVGLGITSREVDPCLTLIVNVSSLNLPPSESHLVVVDEALH